jgi:hypothetical protein
MMGRRVAGRLARVSCAGEGSSGVAAKTTMLSACILYIDGCRRAILKKLVTCYHAAMLGLMQRFHSVVFLVVHAQTALCTPDLNAQVIRLLQL